MLPVAVARAVAVAAEAVAGLVMCVTKLKESERSKLWLAARRRCPVLACLSVGLCPILFSFFQAFLDFFFQPDSALNADG